MKKYNYTLSHATRTRIVRKIREGYVKLEQIQPFFKVKIDPTELHMIKRNAKSLKTYMNKWVKYRICPGCSNHKEENEENFRRFDKEHTRFHSTCRMCKNTRQTVAKRKNIKESRAYARAYYHDNKEKFPKRKSKKISEMTPQERVTTRARRARASTKKREAKRNALLAEKRLLLNEQTNGTNRNTKRSI